MRLYDAVVFDLDGTLLDTLDDLADSVNHALVQNGCPERSLTDIRRFVGNGIVKLLERAVPQDADQDIRSKCLRDFQAHYLTNMQNKTAPYPGILDLLHTVKDEGCKVAVASNKFEPAVKGLCPGYFGMLVDVAVGESPYTAKKPAPDMVQKAMAEMGAPPEKTVYVGDSEVDIETARNAGLPCIAVTWGFRDRSCLLAHGAVQIVDTAGELRRLLIR